MSNEPKLLILGLILGSLFAPIIALSINEFTNSDWGWIVPIISAVAIFIYMYKEDN